MQTRMAWFVAIGAMLMLTAGCVTSSAGDLFDPIETNPDAQINVSGTWRWGAQRFLPLVEGEIDLSQDGTTVTVEAVRYILNPVLRDLEGQAELDGNVLTIQMRPRDGSDYLADSVITFSDDGKRFLATYIDSNGDDSDNLGVTAGEKIE